MGLPFQQRWRFATTARARLRPARGTRGLAPNERALSLARRPSRAGGPIPTRAAWRARAASARAAPPPHRERARWPLSCAHAQAGRARGQGWRVAPRPCTERERPVAGAAAFIGARGSTSTSAAQRAHAASARAAPPPERESARWRFLLRTCARQLLVGGRGWHVGARPCTEGEGRLAGAVGFIEAWPTPTSAARRAHAASARAAPPPERERARWRFFLRTCASKLLVGGRGWHVGARPCTEGEGRLAGAVGFHRAWADSNQRGAARARRKRACCASSRERESARSGAFFLRTCASKLLVGGRGWHVGARPCTEGEGRLAGAVGFHRAWTDSNQRGAARARRKRACCASSRERERAVALFLAHMRKSAARWRPRLARRSTAVHRGRGPSRWRSGLP